MSKYAKYGWIVDVDHLAADGIGDSAVGVLGPSRVHPKIQAKLQGQPIDPPPSEEWTALLDRVQRWRCKDSDGELYYEGRYIGTDGDNAFGPLVDFCQPDAGATDIEYLDEASGEWRAL